jgi:hypothetical protein
MDGTFTPSLMYDLPRTLGATPVSEGHSLHCVNHFYSNHALHRGTATYLRAIKSSISKKLLKEVEGLIVSEVRALERRPRDRTSQARYNLHAVCECTAINT